VDPLLLALKVPVNTVAPEESRTVIVVLAVMVAETLLTGFSYRHVRALLSLHCLSGS
jgi:hypothetical protein